MKNKNSLAMLRLFIENYNSNLYVEIKITKNDLIDLVKKNQLSINLANDWLDKINDKINENEIYIAENSKTMTRDETIKNNLREIYNWFIVNIQSEYSKYSELYTKYCDKKWFEVHYKFDITNYSGKWLDILITKPGWSYIMNSKYLLTDREHYSTKEEDDIKNRRFTIAFVYYGGGSNNIDGTYYLDEDGEIYVYSKDTTKYLNETLWDNKEKVKMCLINHWSNIKLEAKSNLDKFKNKYVEDVNNFKV